MSADSDRLVRIGIVEDHPRYREALRATVDSISDVVVAWMANDGTEARAFMGDDPVELAIIDISLPGENGIALVGHLRSAWPRTTYAVLSGHTENSYVRRSLEAGACAYVVKGRPSELRAAIAACRRNERYLSPQLEFDG